MLSRQIRRVGVAVVLGAVLLAGAGTGSAALAGPSASPTVKVVLKEWTLKASATKVKAGRVTFVVKNAGALPHEFVIVKTNRHHHLLPMKGSQAVEKGKIGEIEEFAPGGTKRLSLRLKPGKYVLLCNLPGHYKAGQYAALQVS